MAADTAAMPIFSRCVFYLDPNARLTTLSPADEAMSQDFADASTHELAQKLTDCGGTVLTGTGALPVARLRGVCTQPRWRACGGRERATAVALAICSQRRAAAGIGQVACALPVARAIGIPVLCAVGVCTVRILHGPSRWL